VGNEGMHPSLKVLNPEREKRNDARRRLSDHRVALSDENRGCGVPGCKRTMKSV